MGLDEIKEALRGVDGQIYSGLPSEIARKNLALAMQMIDEMMRDEKQAKGACDKSCVGN